MTASIIGCVFFSRVNSATVCTPWSSHPSPSRRRGFALPESSEGTSTERLRRKSLARRRGLSPSRDEFWKAIPSHIGRHGDVLEVSAQPFHRPAYRSATGPTEVSRSTHPRISNELGVTGEPRRSEPKLIDG